MASGRDDVAVIRRGTTLTVANLGDSSFDVELGEGEWQVVFASQGSEDAVAAGALTIAGETTVVLAPV